MKRARKKKKIRKLAKKVHMCRGAQGTYVKMITSSYMKNFCFSLSLAVIVFTKTMRPLSTGKILGNFEVLEEKKVSDGNSENVERSYHLVVMFRYEIQLQFVS